MLNGQGTKDGEGKAEEEGQKKEKEVQFFKGIQDIETVKNDKQTLVDTDNDINIEIVGWIKKFLYPYALDPSPFKPSDVAIAPGLTIGQLLGKQEPKKRPEEKFDILTTNRFNFPLSHLDAKEEFLRDIIQPIRMTKEQIMKDMLNYTNEFPVKLIPHITEQNQINDMIHCYKRPK